MRRAKLVGIGAAALAMLGGPLGAAPAQAGCVHWTCEAVFDAAAYAEGAAVDAYWHAVDDYRAVFDAVGKVVLDTACTVFPTAPQCT